MSVHHEYDASIIYTPEQLRTRRCFIARVAIQQWLAWEKNPYLLSEEEVEDGFKQTREWLSIVRPTKPGIERRDIDDSRDLFADLETGTTYTELAMNHPQNGLAHRLNSLHRTIGAAIRQYEQLYSGTELIPAREEDKSTIRDVSQEIRLLEPYRSILIARRYGWSDPEIEDAFSTMDLSSSGGKYNGYSASKVIETRSGVRLRDKLGDDHPELTAFHRPSGKSRSRSGMSAKGFVPDFEQYLEIPQYIHDHARKLKGKDVAAYVGRYLNGMLDCRDTFIPDLRRKYHYTGSLPVSGIQATCFKSPNNYKEKISKWFSGSLEIIDVLQKYGNLAPQTDITQYLIHNYRRFSDTLSTIDAQLLSGTDSQPDYEQLEAIRTYYTKEGGTFTSKYGWETSLLAYAIKKYFATRDMQLSDEEAIDASRYIAGTPVTQAASPAESAEEKDNWTKQIELAMAYIADARSLEKQGVLNPLTVARYYGKNRMKQLFNIYAPSYISRGMVRHAMNRAPLNTEKYLDSILEEREELSAILERQGYTIDVDTLTYLANRRPSGAEKKASRFLDAYVPLLDEYRGFDYFEEWMAARSIVRYPDNPVRGIKLYTRLARTGFFVQSSTLMVQKSSRMSSEFNIFEEKSFEGETNDDQDSATRDRIDTILQTVISQAEKQAVYAVFQFLPNEEIDEIQIAKELGTNDLETYVVNIIIPKLQSSHISLSDFL